LQFASGRAVLPVLAVRPLLDEALRQAYDAYDRREGVWRGEHAASEAPSLVLVKDVDDDVEIDQAAFAEALVADQGGASDLDDLEPVFERLEIGTPLPQGGEDGTSSPVPIGQVALKQVPV